MAKVARRIPANRRVSLQVRLLGTAALVIQGVVAMAAEPTKDAPVVPAATKPADAVLVAAKPAAGNRVAVKPDARTASRRAADEEPPVCNFSRVVLEGVRDYRLRDADPEIHWAYEDNKKNHVDLVASWMGQGELTERVMSGLDWTLVRWPNHIPTLRALVDYAVAGGRPYSYQQPECYFEFAKSYAPDDIMVRQVEGFFFVKMGKPARAEKAYLDALKVDGSSAEVHYNLGLLYVQMGSFVKAVEQAKLAYSQGYPLPGLRRKLEKAGYRLQDAAQR